MSVNLADCAAVYVIPESVTSQEHRVVIRFTRTQDGAMKGWSVEQRVGGMNYHELLRDGTWRYGSGFLFPTAQAAFDRLMAADTLKPYEERHREASLSDTERGS